jgi:hypothetical protein
LVAGNKKSLADAMKKGIDLREQILKLYRDYYYGGLMKLVVIGGGRVFFSDSPDTVCCILYHLGCAWTEIGIRNKNSTESNFCGSKDFFLFK